MKMEFEYERTKIQIKIIAVMRNTNKTSNRIYENEYKIHESLTFRQQH